MARLSEIPLDLTQAEGHRPWLSEPEQQRCTAIKASRRRMQFIAGRWLARHSLAAWAGGAWADYALSAPQDAAPRVLRAPEPRAVEGLHLSISHSADWVACALARHSVGVDVEDISRGRDTDALGALILGDQERAQAADLPLAERRALFFDRWTLKEAWIKQHHDGLSGMLSVQFMPCPDDQADALVWRGPGCTLAVVPARPGAVRWAMVPVAWPRGQSSSWRCVKQNELSHGFS